MSKVAHAKTGQGQRGGKKDSERLKFIDWLSLPSWSRDPQTQEELAQGLGVAPATLSDWKRQTGFWDEVREKVDECVKEHHADVLGSVLRSARDGEVAAQKLYLEYVQGWAPKQKHEVDMQSSIRLQSPEDRQARIAELLAKRKQ
jgi:uncharacterized protein YjcR